MKKKLGCCLLAAGLLLGLWGCGGKEEPPAETVMATQTVEETVPPTVPADGNKDDVTCKGSYTDSGKASAVAAEVDGKALTNGQLAVWYWAEVASYRQAGHEIGPDYRQGLDTQICEIDDSVNSWQQYFLRRALERWHGAQALVLQGEDEGLPEEEAHQPDPHKYETYLTNIPATKFLYRYEKSYTPNTMHQAYLDNLPQLLDALAKERDYADVTALAQGSFDSTEANVLHWAELYNRGYMYFTNLSYFIELTEEEELTLSEAEGTEEYTVDIRHILLTGTSEDAQKMLKDWQNGYFVTEATFAELARQNSEDEGSCINGGSYVNISKGQLVEELDAWCFDSERKAGDTTVITTAQGNHILYFCGSTPAGYAEAEAALMAEKQAALVTAAKEKYPMEVNYSAISLPTGEGAVSYEDILYADVAHERFPEVPLYLQADYATTKYGKYRLSTHGCGITSMAMLASYMTDDELTPAELAARYGHYCFENGTDGSLFVREPAVLGFYLKERIFDFNAAKRALQDGYILVVSESEGYWTRGGHFLVLESIDENDMVQVRDSNIFNYQKLPGFKEDKHPWEKIYPYGKAYWVFEKKVTRIPACGRCGEGKTEGVMTEAYLCEKCAPAVVRRDSYLNCLQ